MKVFVVVESCCENFKNGYIYFMKDDNMPENDPCPSGKCNQYQEITLHPETLKFLLQAFELLPRLHGKIGALTAQVFAEGEKRRKRY